MKSLRENLQLRWATAADVEQCLSTFNGIVHGRPNQPSRTIAALRSWLDRSHPVVRPADWTIVEDLTTGEIVSTCALYAQRWNYAGISFGVGQIEFVGTDPAYRRQGLVRQQIDELHAESARRGHLLQVIGGIPNYYRQFGYELALAAGGGRIGDAWQNDVDNQDSHEPYQIRPATAADLPFIAELDRVGQRRSLVNAERDEGLWRLELDGRGEFNIFRRLLFLLETGDGQPVGFFARRPQPRNGVLLLARCEMAEGVNWLAVAPVLWRHLSDVEPASRKIDCWLGTDHPLYHALPQTLAQVEAASTFYMRIPDLAAFLRQIAPILEGRLATSIAVGYSGAVRLNFYRSGLLLVWEHGRLTAVTPWQQPNVDEADLSFPDLTFTQLLLGYRSFAELEAAFADCMVHKEVARVLVDILWPKAASQLWSLG
ncbi:MAG: GNAT family N-acetyltransferase [Caldilineaceae bacterium]